MHSWEEKIRTKIYLFLKNYGIICLLALVYSIAIIWLSLQHEIYRDEMRALSFVLERDSIPDFFHALKAEGHPALWYFILYLGWLLVKSPVVLNIAGLAIAITAVIIFLFRSPFTLMQKVLFIFGGLPFYEYSVVSRNYGIGMLLLFVFCSLYTDRFKKPLLIGTVVFFLAQTNLPCMIISFAIFFSLTTEYYFSRKMLSVQDYNPTRIVVGLVVILLGVGLAVIQIYPPDPNSIVIKNKSLSILTLISTGRDVLRSPGHFFSTGFGTNATIIIWLILLYFLRKPFIFTMLFIGIIGIGAILVNIPGAHGFRHIGFVYLLVISALWLEKENQKPGEPKKIFLYYFREGFIFILMLLQIYLAFNLLKEDILYPYSSSRSFGDFIKKNVIYHKAIIVGEPDYYLESLPYYISNPLYFPRENRFGKVVNFTVANKQKLSLAELLTIAQRLKARYNKPILLELGHPISAQNTKFHYAFSYGKIFDYDSQTIKSFIASTRKIAEFKDAYGDENYTIYEVIK